MFECSSVAPPTFEEVVATESICQPNEVAIWRQASVSFWIVFSGPGATKDIKISLLNKAFISFFLNSFCYMGETTSDDLFAAKLQRYCVLNATQIYFYCLHLVYKTEQFPTIFWFIK